MTTDEEKSAKETTPRPPLASLEFGLEGLGIENANPDRLLHAVNESAHAVRNGWVFFLALTAFFFVTVAGVTHQDLLLNSPVSLPVLQVGIALKRFFLFAPLVLVLVHFAILLQYAMLARKTRALHNLLAQKEKPGIFRTHPMRLELSSYFFVQAMAGPTRSPVLGIFLTAMSWLTLGLFPLALLLFFQIAFLPFHDAVITWSHRAYLVTDFLIIISVGIFTRFPERNFWVALWRYVRKHSTMFGLTFAGWLVALFFSFAIATIPGFWMERQVMALAKPLGWNTGVPYVQANKTAGKDTALFTEQRDVIDAPKKSMRKAFFPTAYLFEGVPDRISGKATSWFSRNIMVTDIDLVPYEDEAREKANEVSLHLRGRDLTYAYFDRSDLHRADLTGANLSHASMIDTNLSRARMRSVKIEGANLETANLKHTDLHFAKIYGSNLKKVQLQCANLFSATVIGSNLREAKLQGSNLRYATIQASSLQHANLLGVNLLGASLQVSDLTSANMQGTNLSTANLTGVDLGEASLQGADMSLATVLGTNFNLVQIWQTRPPESASFGGLRPNGIKYQSIDTSEETRHYIHTACENSFDRTNQMFAKKRMSALLDGAKVTVWAGSMQHDVWKALSASKANLVVGNFKADYTKSLARLACQDSTKGVLLARKIIDKSRLPAFAGDRELLRKMLLAKTCPNRRSLPFSLLK